MIRDIRNLDLNLLKALDALLAERNVTRAAERLNLTQPAVSGMLARLRDSFDDPLFVRGQRGIIPTPRALQLAEPLRRMLGEAAAMLTPPMFDPAHARLTLSLAATDYAQQVMVVPFLARLRAMAPGVRVAVRGEDMARMSRFEDGDLDLALMTPDSAPQGLHARHLFDETYVVAMRDGHPDAGEGALLLDRSALWTMLWCRWPVGASMASPTMLWLPWGAKGVWCCPWAAFWCWRRCSLPPIWSRWCRVVWPGRAGFDHARAAGGGARLCQGDGVA
jgi:DNA-binding transcriptional LysR family regulator